MAASDVAAAIAAAARRERGGALSSSSSDSLGAAAGISSSAQKEGKSELIVDISPFVTTVLAPEGGEVDFDVQRLLEMGVTRARIVKSRRGGGLSQRIEFDPDALVAALAEEVASWRAENKT